MTIIEQPRFDPPYVPMEGKSDSIAVQCNPNNPDEMIFTFQPWNQSNGWLEINLNGQTYIFQREWKWNESVVLPHVSGFEVVYYSGGEWHYNIIPGRCKVEVTATTAPPTTTTTEPPPTTTTTEPPVTTTTEPPTTTTEPEPTTTTVQETTTTVPVPVTVPSTEATVLPAGPLASSTNATALVPLPSPRDEELAFTGYDPLSLVSYAMVMVVGGAWIKNRFKKNPLTN